MARCELTLPELEAGLAACLDTDVLDADLEAECGPETDELASGFLRIELELLAPMPSAECVESPSGPQPVGFIVGARRSRDQVAPDGPVDPVLG